MAHFNSSIFPSAQSYSSSHQCNHEWAIFRRGCFGSFRGERGTFPCLTISFLPFKGSPWTSSEVGTRMQRKWGGFQNSVHHCCQIHPLPQAPCPVFPSPCPLPAPTADLPSLTGSAAGSGGEDTAMLAALLWECQWMCSQPFCESGSTFCCHNVFHSTTQSWK